MYRIVYKNPMNPTVTLMDIEAPQGAAKAQSRQFIILRVDDDGERIPLTIAVYDRDKGTVRIIYQIVVGHSEKTNSVLDICAQVIGRKFGNHSCVKSQERHAGNNVQFCASGLFFEGVAPHKTFVDGWGKAKKNFSQSKEIEITLGSGQRCVFTVHGIFRCHKNPPFK